MRECPRISQCLHANAMPVYIEALAWHWGIGALGHWGIGALGHWGIGGGPDLLSPSPGMGGARRSGFGPSQDLTRGASRFRIEAVRVLCGTFSGESPDARPFKAGNSDAHLEKPRGSVERSNSRGFFFTQSPFRLHSSRLSHRMMDEEMRFARRMNRAMAMKKKKKREVRAIRAFPALLPSQQPFAARVRRAGVRRRFAAIAPVVPDPDRFYHVPRVRVNVGPSKPRGKRLSFPQKRAHLDVVFPQNERFEASFSHDSNRARSRK